MWKNVDRLPVIVGFVAGRLWCWVAAQQGAAPRGQAGQKIDAEYTAKIKEYLQDPRITTELVDHLPASDTVPTPLEVPRPHRRHAGRADLREGHPSLLRGARQGLAARALLEDRQDRGRPRHGRARDRRRGDDQVARQVSRSARPRSPIRARRPRRRRRQLLKTAKPIYYLTSGMHSPENGGPEMLHRARLSADRRGDAVHPEHPQQRDHVHHAGHRGRRPREAGRHLLLQQDARAGRRAAAADVLGQVRAARQQPRRHGPVPRADQGGHARAATSGIRPSCTTCTRRRPISTRRPAPARTTTRSIRSPIGEWWLLAQNDVMEMTKRGVPGVWTYGFYDGWVPNYMFFIAHSHNAIGRFYEVQSYGPDNYEVRPGATTSRAGNGSGRTRRCRRSSGDRATTPTSSSRRVLFSLSHVAKNRETLSRELLAEEQARRSTRARTARSTRWVIPGRRSAARPTPPTPSTS